MLKLFFITTIRNILKHRSYSLLNILGLALGLSAFLYITTYIFYETNFDNFHSKSDRTFRCVAFAKMGDTEENIPRSETPLANVLKRDLPEVEAATRLFRRSNVFTRYKDNKFIEKEIWYADANVFSVFDFTLIEGDKKNVLANPNSILLTQKAAEKYFGNENPIGKTISTSKANENYQVTGILKNLPHNSHLQFDFLASFSTLSRSKDVDWGNFSSTYTYVVVKENIDFDEFEKKYEAYLRQYEVFVIEEYAKLSMEEYEARGNFFQHKLQPLNKIHLNSTFAEESETYGNPRFLKIFGIVGVLILIIACLNFINLTTARASFRTKEIGMKKIVGSNRLKIVSQIFFEVLIYCLLALVVSLVILIFLLPFLNKFAQITITPDILFNKMVILTVLFIPFVTAILAGSYPAFFITKFKLVDVVKRKSTTQESKPWIRGGLVAFQFFIFIVLIFGTIGINKQMSFIRQQNPGFNKENILVVQNMSYLGNQSNSFKAELLKNPSISSATFTSSLPSLDEFGGNPFHANGSDRKYFMNTLEVDPDFLKTLQIQMKEGRYFTKNFESEKNHAIINQEAAKILGWADSNEKILHDINNGGKDYNVVGIVKDFHMKSLRDKSKPLVIRLSEQGNYLSVRLHPGNITSDLKMVKDQWEKFNDNAPFEYFFLDKTFDAQYKSEERLAKIIGLFTCIAICIACMGLLGLVSYSATQKTKEIGIRKVNGAKVSEILIMLNKDFIKWIVMAFFVACPIAYYVMTKWLENFAYKTTLSWWIFALAGVLALGIALLTVSFQSYKAATRNPVEALKYE